MTFETAFNYLKRGHLLTLPEWGGFWRWCPNSKTIFMHCRNGDVIDIRASDNMDYTLSFTFRDDWEIVKDPSQTEHTQAVAASN